MRKIAKFAGLDRKSDRNGTSGDRGHLRKIFRVITKPNQRLYFLEEHLQGMTRIVQMSGVAGLIYYLSGLPCHPHWSAISFGIPRVLVFRSMLQPNIPHLGCHLFLECR